MGIGPGDEVIVPAYTYTASASVIAHVGAKIVMIDSQKDSLQMDYDALEAAITGKNQGNHSGRFRRYSLRLRQNL